jgi:hypothetical protein
VLPYIALSYNTSFKEGTSITPYDLVLPGLVVFARSPRPLQSVILPPRRPDLEGRSTEEIGLYIEEQLYGVGGLWHAGALHVSF